MKGIIAIVAFSIFVTMGLTACEKPLQAAHFNQAIDKAADKLAPSESSAEKAGEKIDQTRL